METTPAIKSSWPMKTLAPAMPKESSVPRRGLPDGPWPLAKETRKGTILSEARDFKILGAPRNEAMAEDRVAETTPALINQPYTEICFMAP